MQFTKLIGMLMRIILIAMSFQVTHYILFILHPGYNLFDCSILE